MQDEKLRVHFPHLAAEQWPGLDLGFMPLIRERKKKGQDAIKGTKKKDFTGRVIR